MVMSSLAQTGSDCHLQSPGVSPLHPWPPTVPHIASSQPCLEIDSPMQNKTRKALVAVNLAKNISTTGNHISNNRAKRVSGRTTMMSESLAFTDGPSPSRVPLNEQLKDATWSLKTSKSNFAWLTMMLKESYLSVEIKWAISSLPFVVVLKSERTEKHWANRLAARAQVLQRWHSTRSITVSCPDSPLAIMLPPPLEGCSEWTRKVVPRANAASLLSCSAI